MSAADNSPLTLVIMAAGMGARYGGLKQVEPIRPAGERIIDYSIYDALKAGFEKIVLVIRRDLEPLVRSTLGDKMTRHAEIIYVHQELDVLPNGRLLGARDKPWGTGQAVLVARSVVSGPFAVINADDFYGKQSYQVLAENLRQSADPRQYFNVGYRLDHTLTAHGSVARGVCTMDAAGFLQRIEEHFEIRRVEGRIQASRNAAGIELSPQTIVSMNMWGFTPTLFDELERSFADFLDQRSPDTQAEFLLPDFIGSLLSARRARVLMLPTTERWVGITYQADLDLVRHRINQLVEGGVYPLRLWE